MTLRLRVEISIPAEEWGQQASIADAERLVVVGRGIGSKKNLPLMRKLADALGAELGCTRPVVEAGWLEYRHQVGQTGVSVSPKLLVSIGVSGAIQHLAGIGGAECVIAVNEDPMPPSSALRSIKLSVTSSKSSKSSWPSSSARRRPARLASLSLGVPRSLAWRGR